MIKKFNVEKTKQLNKVNKLLSLCYRKPSLKSDCALDEIENILIIDFALMGDMIMNIPFLRTIKRNCPFAKITMVCMPWAETILGDQGLVDNFIIFDGKNYLMSPKEAIRHIKQIKATLRVINQKRYQLGIEPKGDLRHCLFLRYTNCDRTVSYNYTGGSYLITDCFQPKAETRHLIDEKLDLLEMIGLKIYEEDRIPSLILTNDMQTSIINFKEQNGLTNKKIVGIHPGASNTNKQYRYYPDVVHYLAKKLNESYSVCVFEGPGEAEIVDQVCKALESERINFVRVKRSTKEYISIVSICDCMICNDSAAGHLAAAYGRNCLIIFGPVEPETALPRGTGSIYYVSHALNCKPCTLPSCPLGTEDCLNLITLDEVQLGIDTILANGCG